jgi:hypothetical protein
MQCGNNVNDKGGGMLVEQPIVKSGVLNAAFVEKLQVDEPRNLIREKRGDTLLGIASDSLSATDGALGMVNYTPGGNPRSLSR